MLVIDALLCCVYFWQSCTGTVFIFFVVDIFQIGQMDYIDSIYKTQEFGPCKKMGFVIQEVCFLYLDFGGSILNV